MTTQTIEAPATTPVENRVQVEVTQDTEITDPQPLTPDPLLALTEQEAITIAVAGLRELIGYKYHFCNRWSDTMGERLPPAIKREQAARQRYEAAIGVLEGLAWWSGRSE